MTEKIRELHLIVALERAIQIAERLNNDMARQYHVGTSEDYRRTFAGLLELKNMAQSARKLGVISEADFKAKEEEEELRFAQELDDCDG